MARALHFISGLPRSGSTLLFAVLAQNPRFQASMSGPAAGLVNALPTEMSGKNEFSPFIDERQRQHLLRAVYDFGEPAFTHDFSNIAFNADEFDRKAGTPSLHNVRANVCADERQTVLPPDLFRRFENDAFWRDASNHRAGIPVI